MLVNTKALYMVGEGRLVHDENGFCLTGCDGKLHYEQKSRQSYTVNSDFNWYELGDVVSVGNNEHLFYCFPKQKEDIVTKIRLAAEEIYKPKFVFRCLNPNGLQGSQMEIYSGVTDTASQIYKCKSVPIYKCKCLAFQIQIF